VRHRSEEEEKREVGGRMEKQRGMGHLYARAELSGGSRRTMPARAGGVGGHGAAKPHAVIHWVRVITLAFS
jgi:hypothetical protein